MGIVCFLFLKLGVEWMKGLCVEWRCIFLRGRVVLCGYCVDF